MGKTQPLKNYLTLENMEDLGSRSNFRSGKEIADDGDVKITSQNTFNIEAEVKHGDGELRHVELHSTPKGFRWKCTCTSRKDLFCKHCVAVGLSQIK